MRDLAFMSAILRKSIRGGEIPAFVHADLQGARGLASYAEPARRQDRMSFVQNARFLWPKCVGQSSASAPGNALPSL
jgi:hypothetical protein